MHHFGSMTGMLHDQSAAPDAHIDSELARALRLSASLNNPDDHAIVADYIAELEGKNARLMSEQKLRPIG